MSVKINETEVFWLDVPFHEVPDRNMKRHAHGWHIVEMCRVTADNGMVGFGETLPNYTWGRVSTDALERVRGGNPFELMWDDSLGAGLQMAILDLAGKAAEVPAHRLLGERIRQWCPLSWWGIDMSPGDYAAEARSAVAAGYRSFKQKARPWWDIHEQVRLTAAQVDADFKLDLDFNEHLNNAGTAVPLLQQLDRYPQVAIYESPIPHSDVPGNRRVREGTRSAIAAHYLAIDPVTALRDDCVDGWVVSGGATAVMSAAHFCAQANMPFWLQLVGTAWTTAMAGHLGAVCSHAQWPAVTCMNMYVDQLVTKPITVTHGCYDVGDAPGLGLTFNEDAMRYRVDGPEKPALDALNNEAIYAIVHPGGTRTWYEGETTPNGFWTENRRGNVPPFECGVRLDTWANDGTKQWAQLAERVRRGPVRESRQI